MVVKVGEEQGVTIKVGGEFEVESQWKWEVVVKGGGEFEVEVGENGKWWSKWVTQEVAVKVGVESEVAICKNWKWW